MGEVRRQYDEEFKRNAVELTRKSGKKVSQVAEDLGIFEYIEDSSVNTAPPKKDSSCIQPSGMRPRKTTRNREKVLKLVSN